MTRTEHNLPFLELSHQRFEQLCFALLEAEGHTVRHWGDAGSEGGCDLVSTGPDGRRWVTQAKRTTSFGPKAAVEELSKVLDYPPDPEPAVYLLIASCSLSRKTEQALKAELGRQGKSWVIEVWGRMELDHKVRFHGQVVKRFFGEALRSLEAEAPHWNVPNRNPYFTGRKELLEALGARLEAAGEVALGLPRFGGQFTGLGPQT